MSDRHLSNFDLHQDSRGVLTAILNVPNSPINVFNARRSRRSRRADRHGRAKPRHPSLGVPVRQGIGIPGRGRRASDRKIENGGGSPAGIWIGQNLFARLEKLPIPTVAMIQGPCLGGGLEFALACKVRMVVNDPGRNSVCRKWNSVCLPGWGGTQRLPRKSVCASLADDPRWVKRSAPNRPCDIGLADQLVEPGRTRRRTAGNAVAAARRLAAGAEAANLENMVPRSHLAGANLVLRQALRGIGSKAKHYPALDAILDAVSAGLHAAGDEGSQRSGKRSANWRCRKPAGISCNCSSSAKRPAPRRRGSPRGRKGRRRSAKWASSAAA